MSAIAELREAWRQANEHLAPEGVGELLLGAVERFLEQAPPDDEPTFVLRGQDVLALPVVRFYARECEEHGLADQATQAWLAHDDMLDFQRQHRDRVKLPDHRHESVTS